MKDDLSRRVEEIERRNARVEADKAWEVSWTRRLLIAAITYVIVGLILTRLHADGAWLDALIPVCGYLLSTLSLPPLRGLWERRSS